MVSLRTPRATPAMFPAVFAASSRTLSRYRRALRYQESAPTRRVRSNFISLLSAEDSLCARPLRIFAWLIVLTMPIPVRARAITADCRPQLMYLRKFA